MNFVLKNDDFTWKQVDNVGLAMDGKPLRNVVDKATRF